MTFVFGLLLGLLLGASIDRFSGPPGVVSGYIDLPDVRLPCEEPACVPY